MKSGKRFLTSLMVAVMLSSINIVSGAERTTVNEGETLNIHELTLENLNYSGNGGAVENKGIISVKDSNFNMNSAQNGGAIYNSGTINNIDNSTFSNNKIITDNILKVDVNEGWNYDLNSAILSRVVDGETVRVFPEVNGKDPNIMNYIYNGEIVGTVYISGNGGAIYSSNGDLYVTNSNFNNNKIELVSIGNLPFASANGGAIYNNGNLTVSNSSFNGNKAILYEKKSNEDMNLTINGGSGGAIYNENGTLTVNNSTFENNSAGNSGGAVESQGELNVNDSKFYNNSVYDNYNGSGGAINARSNLNIKNTEFDKNSASVYGGAIQAFGHDVNVLVKIQN